MFPPKQRIASVERGRIELEMLDAVSQTLATKNSLLQLVKPLSADKRVPEMEQTRAEPGQPQLFHGEMEGIGSHSWLFHAQDCFDPDRIQDLLGALKGCIRIKGAIRIGHAWIGYNRVFDDISIDQLAWRRDSRIEILTEHTLDVDEITQNLLRCLKT
jgi:hypothetical protein